jgi:hypothetical protein
MNYPLSLPRPEVSTQRNLLRHQRYGVCSLLAHRAKKLSFQQTRLSPLKSEPFGPHPGIFVTSSAPRRKLPGQWTSSHNEPRLR